MTLFRNEEYTVENIKLGRTADAFLAKVKEDDNVLKNEKYKELTLLLLSQLANNESEQEIKDKNIALHEILSSESEFLYVRDCIVNLSEQSYLISGKTITFHNCEFIASFKDYPVFKFDIKQELRLYDCSFSADLVIHGYNENAVFAATDLRLKGFKHEFEDLGSREMHPRILAQGKFKKIAVFSNEKNESTEIEMNFSFVKDLSLGGSFESVKILASREYELQGDGVFRLEGFSCDFLRFELAHTFKDIYIDAVTFNFWNSDNFKYRLQKYISKSEKHGRPWYVYCWSLKAVRDLLRSSSNGSDIKKLMPAIGYLSSLDLVSPKDKLANLLFYDFFLGFYSLKRLIEISIISIIFFAVLFFVSDLFYHDAEVNFSYISSFLYLSFKSFTSIDSPNSSNGLILFLSGLEKFFGMLLTLLAGWIITREND